ncbi:MAG: hypothetical protein ABI197_07790 [Granulicella sp.]
MASTTAIDQMTDEQFEQQAFAVIVREFGLGGLARFLRLHRSGTGDYTADRQTWLAGLTIADIARELNPDR